MAITTISQLVIDSDWANLGILTEGISVIPTNGQAYTPDVVFTEKGLVVGKPNEYQPATKRTVFFSVEAPAGVVELTFLTGHGSNGVEGPKSGSVEVKFAEPYAYMNDQQSPDDLNVQMFHNEYFRKA